MTVLDAIADNALLTDTIKVFINAYIFESTHPDGDPARKYQAMFPSGMCSYHRTREEAVQGIIDAVVAITDMRAQRVKEATG